MSETQLKFLSVLIPHLTVSALFIGLLLRALWRFKQHSTRFEDQLDQIRDEILAEMRARTDAAIAKLASEAGDRTKAGSGYGGSMAQRPVEDEKAARDTPHGGEPVNLSCERILDLIADFVGGELSVEQVDAFRAHLSGCPGCARVVETYQFTIRVTRALPKAGPLPAEDAAKLRAIDPTVDGSETGSRLGRTG